VSPWLKSFLFFQKKTPGQRPGNKGGTGLGMPVPMARKRERAGPRRATAYSQKSTSSYHQKLIVNQFAALLIMIKDYTENMSKRYGQKDEKVGQKPTNGIQENLIKNIISIKYN